MARSLRNNDGAKGREDLQAATDVGAFMDPRRKSRIAEMEKRQVFGNLTKICRYRKKSKIARREIQPCAWLMAASKHHVEKEGSIGEIEGLRLECDFEQMRSGRGKARRKAACFE